MIIYFYKLIFVAIFTLIGYNYPPFPGTSHLTGAILGALFALTLSVLAIKIKNTELKNLWSASIGLLGGVFIGWILFELFSLITVAFGAHVFFKSLFLIGFPITGLFIGSRTPNLFAPMNIKEFFRGSSAFTDSFLLDTSAIIDGRIIQVTDSGFIEILALRFCDAASKPTAAIRTAPVIII